MFGFGRGRGKRADDVVEESAEDEAVPERGPFDESEAPKDEVERLDLGSVRLPVPEGGQLQVEVDPAGPVRAVHVVTPVGRLTVSAFAAPRSDGLWREVSGELAEQLRKDGARVHTEEGEWGTELVADSPKAALRFIGVDGPRWLLRGVAAGPAETAEECAKLLYAVLDETIVVRGTDPMPVRTPLPIQLPEAILRHIQQAQQAQGNGQAAQ
ncbi:Protein of unknown function [Saccharopolyspora kobensis]|uniref:DUF3710 domain-containing protein n=1 Tax=Saccharopolyspora kobensis TaxID=146035 RepID=A0A1H6DPQ1_9PSEU|nr:DUF3710 domain-containing protein [Saccharopolyspora kobensis]SEG87357.1 Protein of unknown function [Saccharopolyspora kobensis]SFE06817.1 Protein of unknown function [Saccharopolyspora kobensis]